MRYAITGATGFVGEALTRRLVADGHEVTAVVRNPAKARDLATSDQVTLARADLSDIAGMAAAFDGADGVFHVAGWYKVGDRHPEEGWRVNVEGTRNALQAAGEVGVPRVVYTSTCAVNSDTHGEVRDETFHFTGRHISVYDETKARAHEVAAEFAALADSPDVVIVMPGGIYGPGDTSQVGALMADIAVGKRVMASSKLRMMQAHVDDVVDGHVRAMAAGRRGESYMLAGERSDLVSMLGEVAEITGGPKPIDIPAIVLPVAGPVLGVVGKVLPLQGDYTAEAMRVARASYLATPAKAQRELGWTFRSLHAGLRETAEAAGWV
jgi:nucleoside-diphosphate-sugar epimerase